MTDLPSHRQESVSPTYLLSWIPDSLLDGRADWNKFVKAENGAALADVEDDGELPSILHVMASN